MACHAVLEQAAKGALRAATEPARKTAFDRAWSAAIALEADAAQQYAQRPWPAPEKWRGYAMKRALTRRLAAQLSDEQQDATFVVEEQLSSASGRLRGRPDVIVRAPAHEVRDYKTGEIHDPEGRLKKNYVIQIELYAALEAESSGQMPDTAAVIGLDGRNEHWELQDAHVTALAATAESALTAYDDAVERGRERELGQPGPDACRWCPWAPRCPAFWDAYDRAWWPEALAVHGTITDKRVAARGTAAMTITVSGGAWPPATVIAVTGIDPVTEPALAESEGGDEVALTWLRPAAADVAVAGTASRAWRIPRPGTGT